MPGSFRACAAHIGHLAKHRQKYCCCLVRLTRPVVSKLGSPHFQIPVVTGQVCSVAPALFDALDLPMLHG